MYVREITKIINIEKTRENLVGNKKEFLSKYKKGIPKLINKNTHILWEKQLANKINCDKMTVERIKKTTKLINELIRKEHKQSIFDFGIGNGEVELNLANKFDELQITGLDFTDNNLKMLSDRIRNFYPVKSSFNEFLKNPIKNKYDIILALEVLEHIDPDKVFNFYKKFKKSLHNNGVLIVSVPINENLDEKIINNTNFSAHVRRYTEKIIKYELELSGFHIIKSIKLYAFNNFYYLKTLISNITHIRNPNVIILACKIL